MAVGRQLGPYELVGRIGHGGMGEVWEGTHRHLGRRAAIKLVGTRGAATGAEREVLLERFQREARATSELQSPHTVQLYDFGVTEDGTLYYAMELLAGCSLQTLVERSGPVPPERAVALLAQVCRSLAEAHHQGLIHRDIKPANIFVSKLGLTWDHVKLLDFGLVKYGDDAATTSGGLTGEATAPGTPAYMPPEIVRGSSALDTRADLYSLGCVAMWLLTGEHVFRRDTQLEVVMAHVHDEPAPPSSRTELPIPPELEALVMQCLQKDPAARPRTATALLEALEACPLERPWDQDRARAWWELHRADSWGREGPEVEPPTVDPTVPRSSTGAAPRVLTGVLVAGGLATAAWMLRAPPEPQREAPAPAPTPVDVVADETTEPPAAPAPCTVWADGSEALWSEVRAALPDADWLAGDAPPTDADAILSFTAGKAGTGDESWRSCRSVTLTAGDAGAQVCADCVTREYTFATLQAVEQWHAGFVTALGPTCTAQTIAALTARCETREAPQ